MTNRNWIIGFLLCLTLLFQGCKDDEITAQDSFEGELAWTRAMGGSGEDIFRKAIPTNDGGMALFGYTNSIDGDITDKTSEERDYWLVKMDAEGAVQWNKTYGGSGDDIGRDLVQTKDGGFALVGYGQSSDGDGSNNEGQHDNWIIKTNSVGDIEWERSFGFAGHDHAYGVVEMEDGGFGMAGFLDIDASEGKGADGLKRSKHGVGEFWVHRLNSDGSLRWRRFFGGTNNDRVHALLKAADGGLVLVGFTESNDFDITDTHGEYEIWVVKVGANGNMVWQETYGGSGIDIAYAAANTSDNAYLIGGSTVSTDGDISMNHGNADAWLIKINDSGQLLWEQTYGGVEFEAIHGISPSKNGGFWLAGSSRSTDLQGTNPQGENDFWAAKIDEQGTLTWQTMLGGSQIDFAYDVLETANGNVTLVGSTDSQDGAVKNPKGGIDAWAVQLK